MRTISYKTRWLVVALAALLSLAAGIALAHEDEEVGRYRMVVGWIEEPAYEGLPNGVEIEVYRETGDGVEQHGQGSMDTPGAGPESAAPSSSHATTAEEPVEGLEATLRVEVTHRATGASKVMSLDPAKGQPGRYTAVVIPTAPGVYELRVMGTIQGTLVDETFVSQGGGGDFDDVRSAADLHFPEKLPQARELESAVRGALETAQQAQDAALAASEEDAVSPMLVTALALGAAGFSLGAVALVIALRRSRGG